MENHVSPFFPEYNGYRDQRTDVKKNIQHLHRRGIRLDTEKNPAQQQVTAGGYRQEFTEPLDDTEEQALKDGHRIIPSIYNQILNDDNKKLSRGVINSTELNNSKANVENSIWKIFILLNDDKKILKDKIFSYCKNCIKR